MGYFSKNSGLLGTGQNDKRVGVHDIISSKLNNSGSFFVTGENLIFTTSRMVGPIGPSKQMTDAFYGDYYTADVMDLFGTQPYNGIQRFNVPASGDYRFYMMGAYAGGNRYQGVSNSHIFDTTLTISNEQVLSNYTNANYTIGCPGLLVCDISLTEGDVLDILVGQSGNQSFYNNSFTVAGSGGGASAVWVGGHGSSTWAIAGGGGSDRDAGTGYNNGKGNAIYSTSGGSGGSGSGGTNGSGGVSSDNHGAAGAGLTGNGSSHNDHRGAWYALSPYAHALGGSGWGKGAASAAVYCDPWDGTDSGGIYCYIDPTTYKVTQTGIFRTGLNNSNEGTFVNYYYGTTNTISGYIPSNGAHGGFGGGAAGNWGGAGGAGGYSGGGGGGNGSAGGGGSSYVSGFTYVSHTVYDKNTSYNSVRCPIQLVPGGLSLSGSNVDMPTGVAKGDGFVVMERI